MTRPHGIAALTAAAVVAMGAAAFCRSAPAPATPSQAALLAVLRSDASLERKSAACRQLGRVGDRDAVPVLADLLSDETLSHMARYALEQIPDPAVEAALRGAAAKLKGRLLAGVLHSLGVRRDAGAVELLGSLLGDGDVEVASAAASALGRIGTPPAARALEQAMAAAPDAVKPALWDATIRCADGLVAQGRRGDAAGILDRLRAADVPVQIRVAAARGAVLARQAGGAALLAELLHDKDGAMFDLAVRLAIDLPGEDVTAVLASQIEKLPADRRPLLIQALGNRGDRAAGPAVRVAARQSDPAVRIAAIRAIAQLGDVASLPILLEAAAAGDRNVADAAAAAIVRLPGGEVDTALADRATVPEMDKSLTAIDCLARRQAASATPVLLKVAREGQPQARIAALAALGGVAAVADLPAIVRLLLEANSAPERDAAERALVAVCALAEDKDSCADKLIQPLGQAQGEHKTAILRILESVHGAKALQAVRSAVKDADAEVQDVAVRALCNWQMPDVAPDLMELARSAANANHRILALRGYIRLAYDAGLAADRRLEICGQAAPLAQRDDEKRLLLGALGGIPSTGALAMIEGHIDSPAVREDACAAAVAVADKLAQSPDLGLSAAAVIQAMEKVKRMSRDARCLQSADRLIERARQRMPRK